MMRSRPMLAMVLTGTAALSIVSGLATAAPGTASQPLSTRNSFRLGDAGVLCTAQSKPTDPRLKGMFDRAYLLTCRDAAGAVGSALALRQPVALAALPSALPATALDCKPVPATVDGLGAVEGLRCHDRDSRLDYLRYAVRRGKAQYLVEGLAGYDPALKLALASIALDRAQSGVVQVATTEVSDPAAFARTQAGSLDAAGVRAEAYARGNGNRFAESAEFFESMAGRAGNDGAALAEALANEGLQHSNLGDFVTAARLLARAEALAPQSDGVLQRLVRNYRAINALNQRDPEQAEAELTRKVSAVIGDEQEMMLRSGTITIPLSLLINRESSSAQEVAQIGSGLTPVERGAVLDAQALELAGIALRQRGKLAEASVKFGDALTALARVRDGRILSTRWLQSEIEVERALVAEARGEGTAALAAFDRSIATLASAYPDSPALLAARARKASYLLRSGDAAGARALFDGVVKDSSEIADSGAALRGLLAPYFGMLARDGSPGAAAAMFAASQILQRPGVAQTQAILARQLSAGNDEASSLFRLALARSRELVRTEAEIAQLSALPTPTRSQQTALDNARSSLEALRADQTRLQAQLAAYPRYKALTPTSVDLADLQAALRPGEGYYKMMLIDGAAYALFATRDAAQAMRLGANEAALGSAVAAVRKSIAHEDDQGRIVTEAFDIDNARKLYLALFQPIEAQLKTISHLVFEGDGPMLQLPPALLPASQAGIDAYKARVARGGDEFDFTGVEWLGRGREMSISVGPRSFLDVRAIASSRAAKAYLGLGSNERALSRPSVQAAVADECDWPIALWQNPISADELKLGERLFGSGASQVLTGAAFNDTALLSQKDLSDYRIVHFATHGLVTPPKPGCPARPALVTSFAPAGSDGLLSFREIFDLKLDADVVILSACDTAGSATAGASLEAGIATGGGYALDGLVRAFVGAGARSVVASHWPVPDDYDATKRLISGLLEARPGQPIGDALGEAQRGLMDDARTSHPFYWAAFIIVGDGAKPLVGARAPALASGAQAVTIALR